MNPYKKSFEEAKTFVVIANTPNFLKNKLTEHPIIPYLVDRFSTQELVEKLRGEISLFNGTLTSLTVIYLLLTAVMIKSPSGQFRALLLENLQRKKIPWASELVSLLDTTSKNSSNSTEAHLYAPLSLNSRTKQNSKSENSFDALAWN